MLMRLTPVATLVLAVAPQQAYGG